MAKYPVKHYAEWTKEEIKLLEGRVNSGMSTYEMARRHQRTENSILMMVEKIRKIRIGRSHLENRLIINGKNYDELLDLAKMVLHMKVNIMGELAK